VITAATRPEDYLGVLQSLTDAGCSYFLEGGQAVNFWAEYFTLREGGVKMGSAKMGSVQILTKFLSGWRIPNHFEKYLPLRSQAARRRTPSRLLKEFIRQTTLTDHGTEGSDGNVLARVRNDDRVAMQISIFGVATPFGDELEVMAGEDTDEIRR
jgi:hypothetical protein